MKFLVLVYSDTQLLGEMPVPEFNSQMRDCLSKADRMLHAYPIAVGPTVPARFTGRIDGNTVTITATVNDTVAKQTVVKGPVTVVFGAEAKLGPCPICRRQVVTSKQH